MRRYRGVSAVRRTTRSTARLFPHHFGLNILAEREGGDEPSHTMSAARFSALLMLRATRALLKRFLLPQDS